MAAFLVVPCFADDDLASKFKTAPVVESFQRTLSEVRVNGISMGVHELSVRGDEVTIPKAVLQELRLGALASDALELSKGGAVAYEWLPSTSVLSLTVPASALQALRIGLGDTASTLLSLSPEEWGGWLDYDMNARRALSGGSTSSGFGGTVQLRGTGPDFRAYSAWSYDSGRKQQPAVRLDSSLQWKPADRSWSVSVGDGTSSSYGAGRAFRYGGISIGTDVSGQPGFSYAPVPQVTGTAAAQSNIDVYVDNQRVSRSATSGGAFTLNVPGGAGNRVVVTDVTGKQTIISVEAPLVDARILPVGTLLWSAGLGVPRFGYGSVSDLYGALPYAYGNARYGLTPRLTTFGHFEAGSDVTEVEAGAALAVGKGVGLRLATAGSTSATGLGAQASMGIVIAGPWGLSLDAQASRASRGYRDVVAVSGIARARRLHQPNYLSLPAHGNESIRLGWLAGNGLSVAMSYDRYSYPSTGAVGFASLSAQDTLWGVPVFASVSRNVGGRSSMSLLAGVSFTFGAVNASASAGHGTTGSTVGLAMSQPLGSGVGDIGWRALATRSASPGRASQLQATAAAEARTGYGIPGVQLDSFAGRTTAYVTARGSIGFVAGHAFVGDPVQGGVIVADAGKSGVPVTVNGYPKGRTGWDGRTVLPVPVSGVPQSVGVEAGTLGLDTVADSTEHSVVVRDGGAALVRFKVTDNRTSAVVSVNDGGHPPPVGSSLTGHDASVPIDAQGRAYMPSLLPDERLTVMRADGSSCTISTHFDGKGGAGRRIGPFLCE